MSRTVAEREDRGRADEFRVASELCLVGENAEIDYGENLMWVLAGLRDEEHDSCEESFYIIPSDVMATNVKKLHKKWESIPRKDGKPHDSNGVRKIRIGSIGKSDRLMFDVSAYRDR